MSSLNIRSSAKASIARVLGVVQATDYSPDVVEVDYKAQMLQQYWDRFVEHHYKLVADSLPTEVETHDELFAETEDMFSKASLRLRRTRLQLIPDRPNQVTTTNHRSCDVRLEPLAIPEFDGQLSNWLLFKDMFESLVHNRTDLDPTYKLGKLRQYVKAEKVPMIGGLYTGGYTEVWDELKRRYDNPMLLSQVHIQLILDLPNRPADTLKALRDIIDCVRNTYRALAVMNLPVQHWDAIIVPVLLPKLPDATKNEWGMNLRTTDIPKLEDLLAFLERRANNMPITTIPGEGALAVRRTHQRSPKVHLGTTSAATCPCCQQPHRLNKCQRFQNLSLNDRWAMVRRLKLCFNCLISGHGTSDCSSRLCALCRRKHNTLLCRGEDPGTTTTATSASTTDGSPNAAPKGNNSVSTPPTSSSKDSMTNRQGSVIPHPE